MVFDVKRKILQLEKNVESNALNDTNINKKFDAYVTLE